MQPTDDATRADLLATLDAQRNHVLGILDGLSDEDLRRSLVPTGWTPLGLVQHLAVDVEQFWFRAVVAGEQPVIDSIIASLADSSDAWLVVPEETSSREIFDLYREEIRLANAVISATPLDAPPAWWPDFFGTFRLQTVREVMLHVITETACHAGHVDIVREFLDGRTWMVLST